MPGWAWARTAVDDRLVVAGTVGYGAWPGVRSGSLVGIDRQSGALRWMYVDPPTPEQVAKKAEWGFAAGPLLVGGTVYAADLGGRVFAIDGSASDGVFPDHGTHERPHHHAAAATSRRTG